jgi:hypothetical protein
MCGSSGNSGAEGPGSDVSCEMLTDNTTLNSLNPAALVGLKTGEILDVQAQGARGPLVAIDQAGIVVGAITSAQAGRILTCITQGHQYVAEVIRINGGQVIISIRHR